MTERTSLRVAVIGAGPAGIYTIEALAASGENLSVDVFEALPAPYGLVRYGVAPDHVHIKSITSRLGKILQGPGVRFFGNVTYGVDITMADLRRCYHAIVFATGASEDRRLGIPGEDLPGSHAAADVVRYYNGHPKAPYDLRLEGPSVAVIGGGNVALDVARVLGSCGAGLDGSDVPAPVLEALRSSLITDVHVIVRKGPDETRFSPRELRAVGELPGLDVIVHPSDVAASTAPQSGSGAGRHQRSALEQFAAWSTRRHRGSPRRLWFHFLRRPLAIVGSGQVEALQMQPGRHSPGSGSLDASSIETLPLGAVVRAIGYRGTPLPDLPYSAETSTVPNDSGRVVAGVYVAGWIKRGATGVIGTNRTDAAQTVATLLQDVANGLVGSPASTETSAVAQLLARRGTSYVDWTGWLRLDAHEVDLGRRHGRPRVKVADVTTMLDIARGL